jgi:hypothetical protein
LTGSLEFQISFDNFPEEKQLRNKNSTRPSLHNKSYIKSIQEITEKATKTGCIVEKTKVQVEILKCILLELKSFKNKFNRKQIAIVKKSVKLATS